VKPLAFGIDFGTTNSIVAVWGEDIRLANRTNGPEALWHESEFGKRPHPSVVWYGPNADPIVGLEARKQMQTYDGMGHTFYRSIKRRLGQNEEVELIGGQRKPAWEVAAEIFRHLKRDAEAHSALSAIHPTLNSCVVTVPVSYNGQQRRDIRRALERSGIRLECFLSEPFAALVGNFYDLETKLQRLSGKRVLVFDWGGGTLDVCLVEVSEDGTHIYELAHDGIEDRSGDDFDRKIMAYAKKRFLNRSQFHIEDVPVKGSAADRFWIKSELAKIELSTKPSTIVEVPNILSIFDKLFDLHETLSREEFEGLIAGEVLAAETCVNRCLERARLTPGLVDHVLMVGGTSNIPAARQMLERLFGAHVSIAYEPDAVIARGAAIVSAENWQPYNVKPIGVMLADDTFFAILPAGTPLLPSQSRGFTFYCVDPRPATANFQFVETTVTGDRHYRALGDWLAVPTNPDIRDIDNLDRIVTRFSVTEDMTLHCVAQSGSVEETRECEIHDICIGLKL